MGRHSIKDDEGNPVRGPEGGETFWSDRDGDSRGHQTVYEKTDHGSKEVPGTHYDPDKDEFHDK